MRKVLIRMIENRPLYHLIRDPVVKRRQEKEFSDWKDKGQPVPPPHIVKQLALQKYAVQFGLKIMVETGTYQGDMVEAMKHDFEHVYSIELSQELYNKAVIRFKGQKKITLINGDSGRELKTLIKKLNQPTLFWLDGHYSGGVTAQGEEDTPIMEELKHIFDAEDKGHVIIIDDARCFGTDPGYPSLEELKAFIKSHRPGVSISVGDDSIQILPEIS